MGDWQDPEVLERLYWGEGMSLEEVADRLGCHFTTVNKWLNRHDIPKRTANQDKPPSLTHISSGDRYYEGFAVRDPDGSQVRVYHHRLLAVAEYGFDGVADKHIHHRNNIPWDNRPSNIEPLSPSSHQSIPPFGKDHDVAPVER